MSDLDAHRLLEASLADALRAVDPAAALRALADDARLPSELRAHVAGVDPDGFRLSALLAVRLRFERVVHGSDRARRMFDDDPATFAQLFRRYHRDVPARAAFPAAEGRTFEDWARDDELPLA